jgi:ABC-type uncharacterized transport system substrate-binding protein
VVVLSNPITYGHRSEVARLAAKLRLPTVYGNIEYVIDGGLMAYAPDLRVMYKRAADYIAKILNGANPADIPIEQASDFKLAVNLKTAKALGLQLPESFLVRADEIVR